MKFIRIDTNIYFNKVKIFSIKSTKRLFFKLFHTLMVQALISGDPLFARTISVFGLMIDLWKILSLRVSGIMSMMVDSSRNKPGNTTQYDPRREKNAFGVSDQVRCKLSCTATEDSYSLEISVLGSRGIVISMQRLCFRICKKQIFS